jgi:hypothetical protein
MERIWIFCALILTTIATTALAQPAPRGDVRTFELHPVAPPTPALKYQLLFDPVDRIHGNAAIPFMQATMLIKPEIDALRDKAIDAHGKDDVTYYALAEQITQATEALVDTCELAARCESCEWQPLIRERGVAAMLPHLNGLRMLNDILLIRARKQVHDGKVNDALATLRICYEIAQAAGKEPVLISGLVSLNTMRGANEVTVELMNRADSPNLYWALATLPRPFVAMSYSMSAERLTIFGSIPALLRARKGEDLSGDEWKHIMQRVAALAAQSGESNQPAEQNVIAKFTGINATTPEAAAHYAQTRGIPADQVAKLDASKVNGVYFFDQYQEVSDDMFKILELPYPEMLARAANLSDRLARAHGASPRNPFLDLVPAIDRAAMTFARADRALAALTTMEAIRSFAATNAGKLPDKLEEIGETPVPVNPMTGQAFDYRVEGDTAVLSDSDAKNPMEYTVRIKS